MGAFAAVRGAEAAFVEAGRSDSGRAAEDEACGSESLERIAAGKVTHRNFSVSPTDINSKGKGQGGAGDFVRVCSCI